ncbi:MAG: pentapeptide repeat-containing protein [Anaerolineales bacterium]|nr:pentapeptide repeat-containing protein [Anaerolineales bacterium]
MIDGTILSQSNLIGADLNYAKLKGANLSVLTYGRLIL